MRWIGIVIYVPKKGLCIVGLDALQLGDDTSEYPNELVYRVSKDQKCEEEQIVEFIPNKKGRYCKIIKIRV